MDQNGFNGNNSNDFYDEDNEYSNADKGKVEESQEKSSKGLGIGSMICGILAVLLFCIPVIGDFFGLILGLVALILGIVAINKNAGKGMGIAGTILGGISFAVSLICLIVILLTGGSIFNALKPAEDRLTGTAWVRESDGSVLYLYDDGTFINVQNENDFTDNFYSGTYKIVPYEDTGLSFSAVENKYKTKYAYDVQLYVNKYVIRGQSSNDIAGNINYLYLFEKKYEEGDTVDVCAHNDLNCASSFESVETTMSYPRVGNQYIEQISEDEDAELVADSKGLLQQYLMENADDGQTSMWGDLDTFYQDVTTEATTASSDTETQVSSEGQPGSETATDTEQTTASTDTEETTVTIEPNPTITTEVSTEAATSATEATETYTEASENTEDTATTEISENTEDAETPEDTEATEDTESGDASTDIWGDIDDQIDEASSEFDAISSTADEISEQIDDLVNDEDTSKFIQMIEDVFNELLNFLSSLFGL